MGVLLGGWEDVWAGGGVEREGGGRREVGMTAHELRKQGVTAMDRQTGF